MKILMLEHPQMDLGAFNLYMGLVEILGLDSIVLFPQKKMYFGQIDDYTSGYPAFLRDLYIKNKNPLPQGVPSFQQGEDVINGWNSGTGTRELPYLVTVGEHPAFTENQIVDAIRAGSFNFIILAGSNKVAVMALARLRDRLGGLDRLPPIVYIDFGERDEANLHWAFIFKPRVIFKLILTPAIYNEVKEKYGWEIHCLPQSSCLAGKGIKELLDKYHRMLYNVGVSEDTSFNDYDKIIDCYSAMGPTYSKRDELIRQIKDYANNKHHRVVVTSPQMYYRYMNLIAHSKIAVSMRGSGRDSSRYWDIPTWQTMMLCDGTMGCMHPHPFEDGKTAAFYDENRLDEIPRILEYYLDNDKERERIAKAGKEWLHKWHTNKARAEHFLEILRRYGL